jgi:hypothetical protein
MGTTARIEPAAPRAAGLGVSAWCVTAAFGAYFCMYGFRKPFTAGLYTGADGGGVGHKTVLVTAQVLGYTLSKFLGVKIVSETPPQRRAARVLLLVAAAWAALLLFALVPPPLDAACLFLNGLPLGMVFGLIVGFLEGRRTTEALTAGLCASFILADGVTKSAGTWLLTQGVPERWMPFAAGGLFAPALLVFVAMLARIPPPSPADAQSRGERQPLSGAQRRAFFRRYAAGLVPLVTMFLLVTVLRSIRADFAPEIWADLGRTGEPAVFTTSAAVVALGVTLANGLAMLVRDNRRAFRVALATSLGGFVLLAAAVAGLAAGRLGDFTFMVLVGVGLYLPYVAVHTTLFERLIALTRDPGNLGYLMCLADAVGYLGYVAVMLARNAVRVEGRFLDFFATACLVTAGAGGLLVVLCWASFGRIRPARHPSSPAPPA